MSVQDTFEWTGTAAVWDASSTLIGLDAWKRALAGSIDQKPHSRFAGLDLGAACKIDRWQQAAGEAAARYSVAERQQPKAMTPFILLVVTQNPPNPALAQSRMATVPLMLARRGGGEWVSLAGLRTDGRRPHEIRRMRCVHTYYV